jgi:hypothetical protein
LLFMALSLVQLMQQNDVIKWRWTSNGQYSAASAYAYQFQGSFVQFLAKDVWHAAAETKSKFFA